MQKVYLLLRNNKQSGPYSLEELIQSGIKPLDLIWIEGASTSWCYPAEVSDLKPYLQVADPTNTTSNKTVTDEAKAGLHAEASSHQAYLPLNKETNPASKEASGKVYVSLPKNNVKPPQQQDPSSGLEQKADEIRARALAYVPQQRAIRETMKDTELVQQQEIPAFSIEQKAAEIRAKVLAYVPEQKGTPDISSSTLEEKAAEIRARALAYVPEQKPDPELIKRTKLSAPDHTKKEKIIPIFQKIAANRNELIKRSPAIITVVLLLIAGGYLISRYSPQKQENNAIVTTQQLSTDSFNVQPLITEPEPQQTDVATVESNFIEKPETEILFDKKPGPVNISASEPLVVTKTKPVVVEKAKEEITKTTSKNVTPVLPPQSTVINPPVLRPIERKVEPAIVKQEDPVNQTDKTEEEAVKAEALKKKKTLTEKIDGFFSKISKKRLEDPEAEQAPPPTKNETQERKAVRRGEEVDASQKKANLDGLVDVTFKESSGKWMLGVYGLKLIVHNRSSETLKRAAVEVRYYNEHEELIEKKVVNINNVPPNKTVIVAAPDHRLADHTDLKLLSASN